MSAMRVEFFCLNGLLWNGFVFRTGAIDDGKMIGIFAYLTCLKIECFKEIVCEKIFQKSAYFQIEIDSTK